MKTSMRLKVMGDTFFLPDPDGSVYFRNNKGSFRMEGSTIDQWIEQLLPVFNGEYTMEDLTDGLPDEYRERVYEIAEVLLGNGFVRDVSEDKTHDLPEEVLRKYAAQIEFLDSFGGSGAYRFQAYRQSNVLAIGAGSFLVSLASALLESGLPRLRLVFTDADAAGLQRVSELEAHARLTDREVGVQAEGIQLGDADWAEVVQSADAVLYVAQDGDMEPLRAIRRVCAERRIALLPAMFVGQAGIAGPLVAPGEADGLESARRRLHQAAVRQDPELHAPSSTAEALLANVLTFEWFKSVTGVTAPESANKLYLLNLETMEGDWHGFLPHPLVQRRPELEWVQVQDMEQRLFQKEETQQANALFLSLGRLTSPATGVLRHWQEGALRQLPLCLCSVQAADPLSKETAELLPELVCAGMTHDEARRQSGLAGVEAYVGRVADRFLPKLPSRQDGRGPAADRSSPIGVGVGETAAEGVSRGLLKWLNEELGRRAQQDRPAVSQVKLKAVEDAECRYYLQALADLQAEPVIGTGASVAGFPSVWVGVNGSWQGSVGFSRTSALRKALQTAVFKAQNPEAFKQAQALEFSSVEMQAEVMQSITVPPVDESEHGKLLQTAFQVLARNRKRVWLADLSFEPFLNQSFAGAFGVSVQEEETP